MHRTELLFIIEELIIQFPIQQLTPSYIGILIEQAQNVTMSSNTFYNNEEDIVIQ